MGGNHRATILYYLQRDIPCKEIDIKKYLNYILKNPIDRFGTRGNKPPYQSIVIKDKVLVEGRRKDIRKRFNYILKEDIVNKTLIDCGCNTGINCLMFLEKGGKFAQGIDISPRLLTSAIRLNSLVGLNCHYKRMDFSLLQTPPLKKYDTGFVFSIDFYLKDSCILAQNILNYIDTCVYFETHRGEGIPKEVEAIFSNIDFLGQISKERKIYRCSF